MKTFKQYCESKIRYSNNQPITIQPHGSNHKLVKQYQRGRCYAAIFINDMSDEEIQEMAIKGEIELNPFDDSTNNFV